MLWNTIIHCLLYACYKLLILNTKAQKGHTFNLDVSVNTECRIFRNINDVEAIVLTFETCFRIALLLALHNVNCCIAVGWIPKDLSKLGVAFQVCAALCVSGAGNSMPDVFVRREGF